MNCSGASFRLADCIKEDKAITAKTKASFQPAELFFCLRLGLCESKDFSGSSFNTRCRQSPFYNLKTPSEPVKK